VTALRLRIVFLALALALALPGALLVRRALASVALEREARERAVAERAFDEMERALTELLRAEEERPAGDYDFASAASPLRERAANALAAGYFQIDADGVVTTPAWAAGVRALAETVAADVPRAAPVPAPAPPPRGAARDRADASSGAVAPPPQPTPAPVPAVEAPQPEAKPEAAPALGAPAAGVIAQAPAEQVIKVEEGGRVEADDVPIDPELPSLYAAKGEGAADAYDALAKLNTGAKERQDRKQRSYVQEQIALPSASAGASAPGAAEATSSALEDSRATAEEIVARALGAEESAREWSAPRAEHAGRSSAAAEQPRNDAKPDGEQLASAQRPTTVLEAETSGDVERKAGAETRSEREAATRAEPARDVGAAAAPAPEPSAAEPAASDPPALANRAALRDEAPAARPELVRVVVDPMRGRLVDGDVYLLVRNARIGERALRQGVAIERAALERLLTDATLARGALRAASVVLTPASARVRSASTPERRVFSHRFAEPFHALAAELAFAPFADEGARSVYWLVALFSVSAAAGLFAVHRMTALALHFAERRSNFAAAVSHELKTPLTAIRLYAEMLRDGLVPSEEKRREYYGSITSETERLSRLINNVLEFSRLERGARSFELRIGEVAPIVREAVDLLRGHAAQHGFALELVLDDALPPVRFERDALVQVVFNLVDNAVKYGRGETARIEVSCRRAGEGVAIGVRDHGAGVPREELGRILEPFYRRGDELTRSAQGAGIGLALVRALVQQMGGVLRVVNADGGGLVVTLELSGTAIAV
jgi:signal transduction histidine kinase